MRALAVTFMLVIGAAVPAYAAEPTVPLTQPEIAILIQGALAEKQCAMAEKQSAPVMEKVRKAFLPPTEPKK